MWVLEEHDLESKLHYSLFVEPGYDAPLLLALFLGGRELNGTAQ